MGLTAEIVAIGTELTSGAKLDTNSQWLSEQLGLVGILVHFHTTVSDVLSEMVDVLRTAGQRTDVVIITGGLGPTLDDITREALAEIAGEPLRVDAASLEAIRQMFVRRGREMPSRNQVQAQLPESAEPLPNSCGTAPGIWLELPRGDNRPPARFAALPGVPSEMRPMFFEQVLPRLPTSGSVIRSARINCFGVVESNAEELLGDLTARCRVPDVGITVHEATITLRITASGQSPAECECQIATARKIVGERMGQLVFGEEDEQLEDVVLRNLQRRQLSLATAESGTGGLLAHMLTSVQGFERSYLGGLIVPTQAACSRSLELDADWLQRVGPVSQEAAEAMATRCRELFQADFALSVTSSRSESTNQAPAVYVALSTEWGTSAQELVQAGNPAIMRARAAKTAIDMLRLHLLRHSASG